MAEAASEPLAGQAVPAAVMDDKDETSLKKVS